MKPAKQEKYTVHSFETRIRKKGLRIVKKVSYREHTIYICAGYCKGDADDPLPHYKTMFSIARAYDDIVLGEFCTTAIKRSSIVKPNGAPIIAPVISEDDCIKQALERAKQRFDDYMSVKCPT